MSQKNHKRQHNEFYRLIYKAVDVHSVKKYIEKKHFLREFEWVTV